MNVGIVGLPQSGKTTLFNALTGAHGDTSGYHAGEHVARGTVQVPDERLAVLADLLSPRDIIPATIQLEDVGGVFAHLTGAEHSGRAVAELREVDAILMVLRAFESEYVMEVLGAVDPVREYRAMSEELLLADLEVIEKRLAALEHDQKRGRADRDESERERDALERCRRAVEEEKRLQTVGLSAAEEKLLRSYAFLTLKPRLCVLNIGEEQIGPPPLPEELAGLRPPPLPVCAELEMELMELEEGERGAFLAAAGLEEMASGRVIRACCDVLGLCTFFTCVSGKLQAWTVEAGAPARAAAGKIHTDMERGFIRAEVVAFADLVASRSMKDAKSAGKVRMEGKDYSVQDGDVITFHFSR